ncbi:MULTISPECIES: hypothetical protein [Rhizobium]|nr:MULTISPECIES: hypothetical protein [Rhizobium]
MQKANRQLPRHPLAMFGERISPAGLPQNHRTINPKTVAVIAEVM